MPLMEQFTALNKKSIQQYINDLITERLKTALKNEVEEDQKTIQVEAVLAAEAISSLTKVDTTPEELEGYLIVKTILRQKINAKRIVHRDAQSYFAILLDDNNRKTICRLYLTGSKKYISTIEEKKEVKIEIETIDDIFNHSDKLFEVVSAYDTEKKIGI